MTIYTPAVNLSGFASHITYANYLTEGNLGIAIMLFIFLLTLGILAFFKSDRALAGALFITALAAILMIPLGIIQDYMVFIAIVLLAISIWAIWWAD